MSGSIGSSLQTLSSMHTERLSLSSFFFSALPRTLQLLERDSRRRVEMCEEQAHGLVLVHAADLGNQLSRMSDARARCAFPMAAIVWALQRVFEEVDPIVWPLFVVAGVGGASEHTVGHEPEPRCDLLDRILFARRRVFLSCGGFLPARFVFDVSTGGKSASSYVVVTGHLRGAGPSDAAKDRERRQ